MRLTKNFDLFEFEFSQTAEMLGIDNTVPDEFIPSVEIVALNLQILRSRLDRPIVITSGYRSTKLNEAVGGSIRSHHKIGYAADFIVPGMSVAEIVEEAKKIWLFDQLINERDKWCHVSFHPSQRGEVFSIKG